MARFERVRGRLIEAGLFEPVMDSQSLTSEERSELARAYFRLGIACPFLENESCSIYPEWPLMCREYLVTTPAEWCSTIDDRIRWVPMLMSAGAGLHWVNAGPDDASAPYFALSVLFEWARTMPEPPPARPGPEVLTRFIDRMIERSGRTDG